MLAFDFFEYALVFSVCVPVSNARTVHGNSKFFKGQFIALIVGRLRSLVCSVDIERLNNR